MIRKAFSRGQTQVLFRHLPGAIFEHDDYGLSRVTSVTQEQIEINRDALFDAMADLIAMWSQSRFVDKFPDPRDMQKRGRYSIGSPKDVRFEPYPTTFTCRRCNRSAKFADLVRRRATDSSTCKECGGSIGRLRYVQAHNCGRMEELFLPPRCPSCNTAEHVAFQDPGRVKQARWYCAKCKQDLQAMRMTPCNCAYSDSLNSPGFSPEKWLKIIPTGDPSLYIAHTAAFVNFPDSASVKLRTAKDSLAIVLGRIWELSTEPVERLLEERERVGKDSRNQQLSEMVEALRAVQPDHPHVRQYDTEQQKPKGQDIVDRVVQLLTKNGQTLEGSPRRWAAEHVTLMDRTSLTSTEDVATMLRRRGDEAGAVDIEEATKKANEVMGIRRIRVINDFPLTLAAFGYTRIARDPARAVLSPFPADDRGQLPVYALSSETEALWFELDPKAVVDWLIGNGLLACPVSSTDAEAWAVLYGLVPGTRQAASEPAYKDRAAVAVRTLLHTMSHVFLRRIEWSGFSPSSVGEYLIPGSLSFILYANRHAETRIGGLTTLFEQRLGTWLWDAVQSGFECLYDPICADDGGSCAGCTHREHNCAVFNRELSRSTLYGGPTPGSSDLEGLRLMRGYWHSAWSASPLE
jgi:transcription elongation factor Elf1